MIKLDAFGYTKVRCLVNQENQYYPLMEAVIDLQVPGHIYVNDGEIESAFICSLDGWAYLIGNKNNEKFYQELVEHIKEKHGSKLIWFGADETINETILKRVEGKIGDYPRYCFKFNEERFKKTQIEHRKRLEAFPYNIEEINKGNLSRASSFSDSIPSFWKDSRKFLEEGIGYIALDKGQVIGEVASASINRQQEVEIDIQTDEQYRRQSVAEMLCRKLIVQCLREGKTPKWDCMINNIASKELAFKLGFEIVKEYPVAFIEFK